MSVLGLGHWLRWSVFTFKVAIRPAPAPAPGGPRSYPWSGHAAPHWAVAGHGAITCLGPQQLATVDTRDSRGLAPSSEGVLQILKYFSAMGLSMLVGVGNFGDLEARLCVAMRNA